MSVCMGKSSSDEIRQKVIGLSSTSVKKSYYPQLQGKIRDLEKKQVQLMELVRDLEERETELQNLLDEKTKLLKEVNHRVKNNLQIIISLMHLGSESSASKTESVQFEKSIKRIETISFIYQEFIFSENYTEVAFCRFLKMISSEIKFEAGKHFVELKYNFPVEEVVLSIDTAIPLALIVNEVVSNSFEYAYGESPGVMEISLHPYNSELNEYELFITDSGPGFPENGAGADSDTLGLRLIDGLAEQIAGRYEYCNIDTGVSFSLIFGN